MSIIPGLPEHLTVIPPAPRNPDDPEAARKRADWRVWRHEVHIHRTALHRDLARDPGLIPFEIMKCAQHPAYFAAMWLTVFEPRWRVDASLPIPEDMEADDPDAEAMTGFERVNGRQIPLVPQIVTTNLQQQIEGAAFDPVTAPIFGYIPFIPFADQVTVMNQLLWTLHQTDENADAVWSKCRGWGASWIGCLLALWGWSFSHLWPGAPPWNVLLLSRKMEYVDSKKQRSLFWKVRRLMRDMPSWMLPPGWDPVTMDNLGIIINPVNGNELAGESTNANAGRGDRVTWAWLDEAAKMPLEEIWGTVTETTDHRWAVSTESLEDGDAYFYNLRTGEDMEYRPYLVESDWWQNPLNDDVWLERQKKRYASNPAVFQREILRDPWAGADIFVYSRARDPQLAPDPTITVDPMAPTFISCDPGQLDDTALVVIQEQVAAGTYTVLDAYQNKGVEAAFYGTLLAAEPDEERFPGMYREREWAFMELLRELPAPSYMGDTYGDTSNGATMDTFYTVIARFTDPHGQRILFNRDRTGGKDLSMYQELSRRPKGRREALGSRVPLLRFSARPGAQFALSCLKSHQFKPDTPGMLTESSTARHDWTSHVVQALEFWSVWTERRKNGLLQTIPNARRASVAAMRKPARAVGIAAQSQASMRKRATLVQVR